MEQLVSALPPSITKRFGEICWAQGGTGYGWWPSYIYDPRRVHGQTRALARKQLGKKFLVYFFQCTDPSFDLLPESKIVEWDMGMAENMHIGKTAQSTGKPRYNLFREALQAAITEAGKPIAKRLPDNKDNEGQPPASSLLPSPVHTIERERSIPLPSGMRRPAQRSFQFDDKDEESDHPIAVEDDDEDMSSPAAKPPAVFPAKDHDTSISEDEVMKEAITRMKKLSNSGPALKHLANQVGISFLQDRHVAAPWKMADRIMKSLPDFAKQFGSKLLTFMDDALNAPPSSDEDSSGDELAVPTSDKRKSSASGPAAGIPSDRPLKIARKKSSLGPGVALSPGTERQVAAQAYIALTTPTKSADGEAKKGSTRKGSKASASSLADEELLYLKVVRKLGDKESAEIGHIILHSRTSTFLDARSMIVDTLEEEMLPKKWRFSHPKLGMMSAKMEVNEIVSYLRLTAGGSMDDPATLIVVEAPSF